MTTNINKIVRGNLTLKPWILSKNTSEIVSTCIEKLYKQGPNNFKNDLLHSKMAAPRVENKGPISAFRSQQTKDRTRQSNSTQSARAKFRTPLSSGDQLLNAVMKTSKKSSAHNFVAAKKLLKSPNYKIYGSRRFGSSASSSSASIFHRYDKQRRNRSQQTAQLNYLLRSFGTFGTTGKNFGLNPAVAKFLVPERNQHMQNPLGSLPQAMEVSCGIQRDLMAIDNSLKDRISLAKSRVAKLTATIDATKLDGTNAANEPKDALRGWHHPNAAELFMSRLNEGGVANAHLQEQTRKLQQVNRSNENRMHTFIFNGVGKKRNRVAENLNAILGEVPRNNAHHVVTKLETALERLPSLRFSSRKPFNAPAVDATTPADTPMATPNATTATATSLVVAEVDASPSTVSRNGRYNRSNHFNRRY